MKTNVYVDGFNLFYGCLKSTPYKWLDIRQLCHLSFPQNEIHRIRYFTAPVSASREDEEKLARQQTYIRALETVPNLTVHYGHFLTSTVRARLAFPIPGLPDQQELRQFTPAEQLAFAQHGLPNSVKVKKTEEKGSDVNIASFLLLDAFRQDCEAAIVISNDSDLATPISMARKEFKIRVVAFLPCSKSGRPSNLLKKVASYAKPVPDDSLPLCQFPAELTDAKGAFFKPVAW